MVERSEKDHFFFIRTRKLLFSYPRFQVQYTVSILDDCSELGNTIYRESWDLRKAHSRPPTMRQCPHIVIRIYPKNSGFFVQFRGPIQPCSSKSPNLSELGSQHCAVIFFLRRRCIININQFQNTVKKPFH